MSKEGQVVSLQWAAEKKQNQVGLAERGVTSKVDIPTSVAALMVAVPSRVLDHSAITITPKEIGKVELVVGPDHEKHLDNLCQWIEGDKKELKGLLKDGYEFLFLAAQASVNSNVNFQQQLEAQRAKVAVLERVIPGIKELRQDLESGRKIQDLIPEERVGMSAQLHALFQHLDHSVQESLKSQGKHPDNAIQYPNE